MPCLDADEVCHKGDAASAQQAREGLRGGDAVEHVAGVSCLERREAYEKARSVNKENGGEGEVCCPFLSGTPIATLPRFLLYRQVGLEGGGDGAAPLQRVGPAALGGAQKRVASSPVASTTSR